MISDTRLDGNEAALAGESLDALIRRAQKGEESAFGAILDLFEDKAILIARGMGASRQDAEDIAQDAFIKVFRYIRSYRSEGTFRAYFYRIVINASNDHLARTPAGQTPLEEAGEIASHPERRTSIEDLDVLGKALGCLPRREREVIILRDIQGLSTWQVARILRISPITVRRHASRALTRLKGLIGPTGTS